MEVKCIKADVSLADAERFALGHGSYDGWLTVNKTYTVLSVFFRNDLGGDPMILLLSDMDMPFMVPLRLFTVTDSRCSSYWHMNILEDFSIYLEVIEFVNNPHLLEHYWDDVPRAVEEFHSVKNRLLSEFKRKT